MVVENIAHGLFVNGGIAKALQLILLPDLQENFLVDLDQEMPSVAPRHGHIKT